MTPAQFRAIALSMPDAVEGSHMGHPDFRVGDRIFATLGHPNSDSAMVTLEPAEQARLLSAEPKVYTPASGAWGRAGSTHLRLSLASDKSVRKAVEAAWRRRIEMNKKPAPKKSPRTKQRTVKTVS